MFIPCFSGTLEAWTCFLSRPDLTTICQARQYTFHLMLKLTSDFRTSLRDQYLCYVRVILSCISLSYIQSKDIVCPCGVLTKSVTSSAKRRLFKYFSWATTPISFQDIFWITAWRVVEIANPSISHLVPVCRLDQLFPF